MLVFQGLLRSCRAEGIPRARPGQVGEGHLGPKDAEDLLTAVLVSPVMSGKNHLRVGRILAVLPFIPPNVTGGGRVLLGNLCFSALTDL